MKTLTNPTDEQLNAAFAEKVAGWKKLVYIDGGPWFKNPSDKEPSNSAFYAFTHSADAVLPWLEKRVVPWQAGHNESGYWVNLGGYEDSIGSTFARAAVIALLRAHGVEIEFTT